MIRDVHFRFSAFVKMLNFNIIRFITGETCFRLEKNIAEMASDITAILLKFEE